MCATLRGYPCPMYEIINVMLLRNATRYINSLLSCIHVKTTDLLNITCTLVAKGMILGRLECMLNWALTLLVSTT